MLPMFRYPLAIAALVAGVLFTLPQSSASAADPSAKAAKCDCAKCNRARGCRNGRCGRNNCINCRPYQYGNPDLFYNFYVNGNCGGVPAGMYPAPGPVPTHVGHVYYTYQPFMPHELMYQHHRSYHRYYDGGRGLTRTRVIYW